MLFLFQILRTISFHIIFIFLFVSSESNRVLVSHKNLCMIVCPSGRIQKKVRIPIVGPSRTGQVRLTGLDTFSQVLAGLFDYIFFSESDC